MALAMTFLFFVVVIVGRVALQYRLTGNHGIRLVSNTSSALAKLSSGLFVIAFIGTIIISALSAVAVLEPQIHLGTYSHIFGVVFCLGGLIIISVSQLQMGKEWRIGVDENEKTKLVSSGIYAKIRNPIYAGIILFGLGLLVLIPHIAMLAFASFVYISIELQVRKVEEPYLRNLHGKSFEHYVNTTGRYLPKIK